MKTITFVTGNANKLKEVKEILNAPLLNKSLDLPELQGNSTQEIAKQKCKIARDTIKGPVMVEDTALCFEALNNLPGPYIKWFLESIGHDGLNKMLVGFNNTRAHALCTFAYADEQTAEPIVFEGRTYGNIVQPRGPTNFGWDPIFQPDEANGLTYAEMAKEDKNKISHRFRALDALREHLNSCT